MLWLATLLFGVSVYYYWDEITKNPLLLAVTDGDMKIAPDFSKPRVQGPDAAETGAAEFLRQRENGNINRSREVGRRLAAHLLEYDTDLDNLNSSVALMGQARVLHAFAINKALEDHALNSIIAHSVLSTFYETVEDKSDLVSREINDSAVFSLYLLATDDETDTKALGELFAKLAERPELSQLGEKLYHKYYNDCVSALDQAGFVR